MNIGKQLKQIREYYKISPYKIEKEINISHQLIYQYEKNELTPSITNCIKLADYYNISLDELVGRDFF